MDAFQIIVIILAAALFIFLVLAIVLVVQLVKISNKIKRITDVASDAVNNFHSVVTSIKRVVTPSVVGKTVSDLIQKFVNNKGKGKRDE
jgi:hypothetical protein